MPPVEFGRPVENEALKYTEHVGMQVRMVTVDDLDPALDYSLDKKSVKKKLHSSTEIKNRAINVAKLIEECSTDTRLQEQGSTPYDDAMRVWAEKVSQTVKAHGKKHYHVFQKLKLGKPEEFTEDKARELYKRFTDSTTTKSLVRMFVVEVFDNYKDNEELRNDLDSLRWLAGIFGKDEAEMAVNLIMAQVNAEYVEDNQIEGAIARAKALTSREQQLLQKLSNKQKSLPVTPAVTPAGPTPPTPPAGATPPVVITPEPAKPADAEDFKINFITVDPAEIKRRATEKTNEPTVLQVHLKDLPAEQPEDLKWITYLEELKLREKFTQWEEIVPGVEKTETILLPGISNEAQGIKYYYQAVKQKRADGQELYACFLFRQNGAGHAFEPVGHVDFNHMHDPAAQNEANCCSNQLGNIFENVNRANLDTNLRAALDKWPHGSSIEAVKLDDAFRGQGLGRSLWYLALTQAQEAGVTRMNIYGDMTQDAKTKGQSFYVNLGAESMIVLEDVDEVMMSTRRLFTVTYLNRQFEEMQRLFEINARGESIAVPQTLGQLIERAKLAHERSLQANREATAIQRDRYGNPANMIPVFADTDFNRASNDMVVQEQIVGVARSILLNIETQLLVSVLGIDLQEEYRKIDPAQGDENNFHYAFDDLRTALVNHLITPTPLYLQIIKEKLAKTLELAKLPANSVSVDQLLAAHEANKDQKIITQESATRLESLVQPPANTIDADLQQKLDRIQFPPITPALISEYDRKLKMSVLRQLLNTAALKDLENAENLAFNSVLDQIAMRNLAIQARVYLMLSLPPAEAAKLENKSGEEVVELVRRTPEGQQVMRRLVELVTQFKFDLHDARIRTRERGESFGHLNDHYDDVLSAVIKLKEGKVDTTTAAEISALSGELGGSVGFFSPEQVNDLVTTPDGRNDILALLKYLSYPQVSTESSVQTMKRDLDNASGVFAFKVSADSGRNALGALDQDKMAAYQVVAKHWGYKLGDFTYDEATNSLRANLTLATLEANPPTGIFMSDAIAKIKEREADWQDLKVRFKQAVGELILSYFNLNDNPNAIWYQQFIALKMAIVDNYVEDMNIPRIQQTLNAFETVANPNRTEWVRFMHWFDTQMRQKRI